MKHGKEKKSVHMSMNLDDTGDDDRGKGLPMIWYLRLLLPAERVEAGT